MFEKQALHIFLGGILMINIKGLDKAQLLVELYNHSHQQGLGMM